MGRGAERRRRFHPEVGFGGYTDIDGTIAFYLRVRALLPADGIALDVGCGRGSWYDDEITIRRELHGLKGHCHRAIGIDPDPAAADNPHIDEFRAMAPDGRWPLEDATVDLAVADFVAEHVEDPDIFFAEAARVLRPGGVLAIRTVNANSYMGLASRAVPNRLHTSLLKRLQPDREADDVFPTRYRVNTRRRLQRAFDRAGLDGVVYGFEAEPDYLLASDLTYRLGLLHRRLAPNAMRVQLFGWARRPGAEANIPGTAG